MVKLEDTEAILYRYNTDTVIIKPKSLSDEQEAALFGPLGRGEYEKGETLRFRDPQSGAELTGKVIFVRAPGPAIQGGKVHPTIYLCYVEGEHIPRAVYPGDVIEPGEENARS